MGYGNERAPLKAHLRKPLIGKAADIRYTRHDHVRAGTKLFHGDSPRHFVGANDHRKLQAFALVSSRPVINAMSAAGHPCEVLSDGFYIHSRFGDIRDVRIGLWGPVTNVMTSWHELAKSLGLVIHHFCGAEFHCENTHVLFSDVVNTPVDVLLTDSWPAGYSDPQWTLTQQHLSILGQPALLPTPPFNIGEELGFDPVGYSGFCGYEQKTVLLKVQQAIVAYLLRHRK